MTASDDSQRNRPGEGRPAAEGWDAAEGLNSRPLPMPLPLDPMPGYALPSSRLSFAEWCLAMALAAVMLGALTAAHFWLVQDGTWWPRGSKWPSYEASDCVNRAVWRVGDACKAIGEITPGDVMDAAAMHDKTEQPLALAEYEVQRARILVARLRGSTAKESLTESLDHSSRSLAHLREALGEAQRSGEIVSGLDSAVAWLDEAADAYGEASHLLATDPDEASYATDITIEKLRLAEDSIADLHESHPRLGFGDLRRTIATERARVEKGTVPSGHGQAFRDKASIRLLARRFRDLREGVAERAILPLGRLGTGGSGWLGRRSQSFPSELRPAVLEDPSLLTSRLESLVTKADEERDRAHDAADRGLEIIRHGR